MAFGVDDLVEGVLGGTAWGIGLTAVAAVVTIGGPRMKPVAKGAIKGYLVATQRAREWTAESTERLQDLYAEAKYEFESGLNGDATQDTEVSELGASEPAVQPARRGQAPPVTAPAGAPSTAGQPG